MVILAAVVALPAFALVPYREVDPRARRVRLGPVRNTGNTGTVRQVFVDGHLVGEAPENARVGFAPCAVPGGVAGAVQGSVDGGYLASTVLGFAAWRGHRQGFGDDRVAGVSRDGTVLLVRQDDYLREGYTDPGDATLVHAGKRIAIGHAEDAWIAPDGTVVGYAFAKTGGGYVGEHSDRSRFPARPKAFVWKAGHRCVLGSWIALDLNRKGTILGQRNEGLYSNLGAVSGSSRLFLYRKGKETRIETGGLPLAGSAFLREDESVVVGLSDGTNDPRADYGVAILSEGKALRVPATLNGIQPDWFAFFVDAKGRIVVPEGRTKLWQVVRKASSIPRGGQGVSVPLGSRVPSP